MENQLPNKLVSVHVPKTGGTTFLEILGKCYGQGLLTDYGLDVNVGLSHFGGHNLAAIHGHIKHDKYASIDHSLCFWVRDPFERLLSQYKFWKKSHFPVDRSWREFHYGEWTFEQFALSKLVRNNQVNYAGEDIPDDCYFVGITEFYKESIELFCAITGNTPPKSIPQHRKNKVTDYENELRADVRLKSRIMEWHSKDYELYEQALAFFKIQEAEKNDSSKLVFSQPSYPSMDYIGQRTVVSSRIAGSGLKRIFGTYYFGDAWPCNVWDTHKPQVTRTILSQIVDDGFNTVCLLIPAAIPILKEEHPDYYRHFEEQLKNVVNEIRRLGLKFIFRLSFLWDEFPVDLDRVDVVYDIFCLDKTFDLWLHYLDELWVEFGSSNDFLFGFICWEDLLGGVLHRLPSSNEDIRKLKGDATGYGKVIPAKDDPELLDFYDFVDSRFTEIFSAFKARFPSLTAEVRVDGTPYYDESGQMIPFVHRRQYIELDTDVIGTYFGSYMMGAGNVEVPADKAFQSFVNSQQAIRDADPSRLIFVDQLLYYIMEKDHSNFPHLNPDNLRQFLQSVFAWLHDKGIGFAGWAYLDYLSDCLVNGSFALGLEGWKHEGCVDIDNDFVCQMEPGSHLYASKVNRLHWPSDGIIMIKGQLEAGATLTVELSEDISFEITQDDFIPEPFYTGTGMWLCEFEGKATHFNIRSNIGRASLTKVVLANDQASNGWRTLNMDSRTSHNILTEEMIRWNKGEIKNHRIKPDDIFDRLSNKIIRMIKS